MHIRTSFLLLLLTLAGCQTEPGAPADRISLKITDLGVAVQKTPRSYLLTDKKGGILVGAFDRQRGIATESWSVDGEALVRTVEVRVDGRALTGDDVDSLIVYPHEVWKYFHNGVRAWISLAEGLAATEHIAMVGIEAPHPCAIGLALSRPAGVPAARCSLGAVALEWDRVPRHRGMILYGGPAGQAAPSGWLTVRNVSAATYIVDCADPLLVDHVAGIHARAESMRAGRAARMERLLNDSYIRTSDENLNRALSWMKLSLDALTVERRDTFALAGIPWDGAMDGRDNAQSLVGLCLATGRYEEGSAIIRTLARSQDQARGSRTYGRMAATVTNGAARYSGADVAPWLMREMYEYVTYSNDTALARWMYPALRRSLEGVERRSMDAQGFLLHGDGETWMEGGNAGKTRTPRGNRAAEVQLLWYFEELVGSYIAAYVGDSASAVKWDSLAARTFRSFNTAFVNEEQGIVYDHLLPNGRGVAESRPNPLLCLEIIESESTRQKMVKDVVNRLLYRDGVGTLGRNDPRFSPYATDAYNGPVWTWLTGQMTYSLTRYDRQDLSYQITERLARRAMESGMVGTLPQMLEVSPRPGAGEPAEAGVQASLTGMAEYVRAVYQDYLGVRIDATAKRIDLRPKLPDGINFADFDVFAGSHRVHLLYRREEGLSRVVVSAPDVTDTMKVRFTWVLENGDAWWGGSKLVPGVPLTLVFRAEEVLAFLGEREIPVDGAQHLRRFSLRHEFEGIDFVDPAKK